MTAPVEFMDLPARGGRQGNEPGPYKKSREWMTALRARPGKWAVLASVTPDSASYYRKRYPEFEFQVRTIDGERRLFGRTVES